MAGKPKQAPQTQAEMIDTVKQSRKTRIYKAESQQVSSEAISKSIGQKLSDIKRYEGRAKISLDDLDAVKRITECYLSTCAVESAFPTMSGLAMSLGYTRQSLYGYMKRYNNKTSEFLETIHDAMADILSENSLKGNSNPIASIFLLKALFGYKDVQTYEFTSGSPMSEPDINEIAQRAGLLED